MEAPLRFDLRPGTPSPLGRRFVVLVLLAGMFVLGGKDVALMLGAHPEKGMLIGALCAVALAAYLWLRWSRAHLARPVEIRPNALVVPHRGATAVLRSRSILGCDLFDLPQGVTLRIAAEGRVLMIPADRFVDAEDPMRLCRAIRERLMTAERLADAHEQVARDIRHAARPVRVARYAVYAVLGAYAVQWLVGGLDDPLQMIRLGANVPMLVLEGQWERLVSANLLHGGLLHVFLNVAALLYLGDLLERVSGGPAVLLLLVLTGLAGQVASALHGESLMSVGASASVFGLLGALGFLNLRSRSELPSMARLPARWWIVIAAMNAALPIVFPRIDTAAHVGGLLAGVLLIALVEAAPRASRILSYVSVGLLVLGLAGTGLRFAESEARRRTDFLRLVLEYESADAQMLNEVAWRTVIREEATGEDLELALRLSQRATEMEPDAADIRDTLATALYRLGRAGEAVEIQRGAIALARADPEKWGQHLSVFGSQLLRFLLALGEGEATSLWIEIGDKALTFRAGTPGPFVAYVRVTRDGEPAGLLELRSPEEQRTVLLDRAWPHGTELAPLLVEPLSDPPGKVEATYWEMDPDVAKLAPYRED